MKKINNTKVRLLTVALLFTFCFTIVTRAVALDDDIPQRNYCETIDVFSGSNSKADPSVEDVCLGCEEVSQEEVYANGKLYAVIYTFSGTSKTYTKRSCSYTAISNSTCTEHFLGPSRAQGISCGNFFKTLATGTENNAGTGTAN